MVYETQKQININAKKGKFLSELPFFTHENALSKFHTLFSEKITLKSAEELKMNYL